MMLEKSEGDLLLKRPRVIGKDRLVDTKLLLFAYFILGFIESFFSISMFFLFLYVEGGYSPSEVFLSYDKWGVGYKNRFINQPEEFHNLEYTAQSVTFVSLVMVQTFGNIFITRSHYLSIWESFPTKKAFRNVWLFASQFVSLGFMLLVLYVPFFNSLFNTRHVPIEYYVYPLVFSFVFVLIEEFRKFLVRRKVKFFVKTAW